MPKNLFDMFIFFCLSLWSGVFGADAVRSVSVTEGDSVTLNTGLTDIMGDELIMWRFGNNNSLIAKMNRKDNKGQFIDERFRDRLQLDQTGSLIITNTRTTDSGHYKVTSTRTETPLNTYNLTVYAHLPVPVITRDSSKNPSSSSGSSVSKCAFLCSVVNVSRVTLSWYKGNNSLSSISVSDLNSLSDLFLHLECLDDSYSCVVSNPISNQTRHLNNTEFCQKCADDCVCCCGSTEAVIRLALSALVGVAAFAVLAYDIRSRSLQQKKREQTSTSNSD